MKHEPKVTPVQLRLAWFAVAAVRGPELGDQSAPLAERLAAFSERLRAFRASK